MSGDIYEDGEVEGVKYDDDKLDWTLVPFEALSGTVRVLQYGARKYSRGNWKRVADAKARYLKAALRHLLAASDGVEFDAESGLDHVDHAIASLIFHKHFVSIERLDNAITRAVIGDDSGSAGVGIITAINDDGSVNVRFGAGASECTFADANPNVAIGDRFSPDMCKRSGMDASAGLRGDTERATESRDYGWHICWSDDAHVQSPNVRRSKKRSAKVARSSKRKRKQAGRLARKR